MVPASDSEPYEFVNDLLYDHDMHDDGFITVPSVIDVGRIPGKGWAIIEINQAWASGIYGCDPGRVLDVLEMASEP
jgi:hypothetical protein